MDLSLSALRQAYRECSITPRKLLRQLRTRIEADARNPVWIALLSESDFQPYLDRLENHTPEELPLYGIPFAIKDNIDLAGIPTTAACPAFAYTPDRSATVVDRLIAAGAIPLGKTNLDQFATGLVGTRSPYGACQNAFNSEYISGGSSSGSAVSVARGHVSFALGTDTAGSGRVPAMLNNLIGLKPTRGRLSTAGVVPACRTLDCVSIFSLTAGDAARIMDVVEGVDPADSFSRKVPATSKPFRSPPTVGVPETDSLEFFGQKLSAGFFESAKKLIRKTGAQLVTVDIAPFVEAARLLYEGPWIAERYAAVGEFIQAHADAVHRITRQIIQPGVRPTAVEAFRAHYRLQELKTKADAILETIDCLLLPTACGHYRLEEIEADPIRLNSNLGRYTNFLNLLDLAGLAIPTGFDKRDLPFGVTLVGPAFTDRELLQLGDALHRASGVTAGATGLPLSEERVGEAQPAEPVLPVVVCGAHRDGMALNHQLTNLGGRLAKSLQTAPEYRFYALPGKPTRPGLVRVASEGKAIQVEVWNLPVSTVGVFLSQIPEPLGLGRVHLEDETWQTGFICESIGLDGAEDITDLADWKLYLERQHDKL